MLSFARSSMLLFVFCLLIQTVLSRTIKSPGFDAKIDKILKQLEEQKNNNATDPPAVEKPGRSSGGVFFMYENTECKQTRARPFLIRPVDKCFNIEDSFNLKTEAKCANGTIAKIATFSTRKCMNPMEEAFKQVTTEVGTCQDTSDIGSMMFWCDGPSTGLDLSENVGRPSHENKGSAAGVFTVLLIILFILMIGIITTLLKFRTLLTRVYNRVKAMVNRTEGHIQL